MSGYNDVSLTVDAVDTSGYVAVSIDGSGAANTLTVLAGSYNTFVGGFDENDSVVIDAYRMGSNLLTLSGSADFEVNNVDSDLNITANGLSGSGGWVSGGSLTVNAHVSGGNNDIQIW